MPTTELNSVTFQSRKSWRIGGLAWKHIPTQKEGMRNVSVNAHLGRQQTKAAENWKCRWLSPDRGEQHVKPHPLTFTKKGRNTTQHGSCLHSCTGKDPQKQAASANTMNKQQTEKQMNNSGLILSHSILSFQINARRCKVSIVCIWHLLSCNCKEIVALGGVPSPPFACQHHHALYLPEIAVHQVTSLRSFCSVDSFRFFRGKNAKSNTAHFVAPECRSMRFAPVWRNLVRERLRSCG